MTATLPDDAWRTMIGLLSLVDDEGRCFADAAYIMGSLFWASPRSLQRMSEILDELAKRRLIERYSVDGVNYLAITGFRGDPRALFNQVIQRPQAAQCPAPPSNAAQTAQTDVPTATNLEESTSEHGKSRLAAEAEAIAIAAVRAINRIGSKAYEPSSAETLRLSRALAKAKLSPERVVAAVEHVATPWVGHPTFHQAIRPSTLLQLKRVRNALDDLDAGKQRAGASIAAPGIGTIRFDDDETVEVQQ